MNFFRPFLPDNAGEIHIEAQIFEPIVLPAIAVLSPAAADARARRFGYRLRYIGPAAVIPGDDLPAELREVAVGAPFVAIYQSAADPTTFALADGSSETAALHRGLALLERYAGRQPPDDAA